MAKGTISQWMPDKGSSGIGNITPDEGDQDVKFFGDNLREGSREQIKVGARVEYEPRRGVEKPTTSSFSIISGASDSAKATGVAESIASSVPRSREQTKAGSPHMAQAAGGSNGYHFLNPYNFVRPLPDTDRGNPLLGRCAPPPHDRYIGLTGQVTCELTAVTPLFTAGSEGVEKLADDHYQYRFFQLEPGGPPTIPGSTIRGAIRSIFEAVTNSCFSVFDGDRRLSKHFDSRKAPEMVPARAEKTEDGWVLRLLTGTTPLQIGRTPNGRQYAAWVYQFWPMRPSGTLRQDPPSTPKIREFQRRRPKGAKVRLNGLKHREACYALLDDVQHPFPRIQFWDVVAVSKNRAELETRKRQNQRIERGWLCLNNQNIEPKHSERFFFRSEDNQVGPLTIELPEKIKEDYEALIRDYQERHAETVRQRRLAHQQPGLPSGDKAGLSRFIYDKNSIKLANGDLVYAYLSGSSQKPKVEFIVPVSVPRVAYKKAIGELLIGLDKCQDRDSLCPACRLFGWVHGKEEGAYRGRLRISHASLIHDAGTFDTTLAILSTPKPTTVRFYLAAKNGQSQNGFDDDQVDYDAPGQVLRGRKFYYHHGDRLSKQEYQRAQNIRDDQNRSVKGVQKAGSRFRCIIDFENLAPIELGALLWTLELEGWHHRFGMARPLGFGSVTVQVTELRLLDVLARYTLGQPGWIPAMKQKGALVDGFKKAMTERYGEKFEQLQNVADLRSLLAESPSQPVHYPRVDSRPSAEGKNFEWFMGNKRAGRDAGPRLTLAPSGQEDHGLPLLDRYGRIRRR
ncbi:MAG: TIGR03986 family CRISPR-associated RAMP protein [Chloroflexi bacterium]|nr:TIGR03986 family CRISPR-associated RAMP protein [Chloroflexota bacterium]MCI0580858.1 TIGR03986 family CRISPR-associated RAMP protein [Chloroflexota bacterium]